ncbi:MAG: hypothetical protein IRZ16_18615 [Myxococcaceae bacterium]|nr:hypothetical protein [Myxococcaceae bacterium]
MRRLSFLVVVLPIVAFASTPIEMTQEEFKMFRHWQKAMEDPRVQAMKPERQNPAIAKDAHYNLKEMMAAVKKGEAAGDLKSICEANLKEALATGAVAGRLSKVIVDTSEPHAVVYVNWANENVSQLEEEASYVAAVTAQQCPIVSTITVWAVDKADPRTRVFQALISREAAARIRPERTKDFADTRYIRLFEGVKNASKGDVIDQNTAGADGAGTEAGAAPTGNQAPTKG